MGRAQFGIDARPEGLLYAAIKHLPVTGGELQEVRWKGGMPPKAVLHQVRGPNWLAVIATSYWSAQQALADAELVGGGPKASVLSSAQLAARYRDILDGKDGGPELGKPIRRTFGEHGNAARVIAAAPAKQRIEADYSVPFLAHATMEPLNCTVRIAGDGKERQGRCLGGQSGADHCAMAGCRGGRRRHRQCRARIRPISAVASVVASILR